MTILLCILWKLRIPYSQKSCIWNGQIDYNHMLEWAKIWSNWNQDKTNYVYQKKKNRKKKKQNEYKLGTSSVAMMFLSWSEIFMYFKGSNTSSWKGFLVAVGLKVSWRKGLSWWGAWEGYRQPDWECRYLSAHAKEEGRPWGAPAWSSGRRVYGWI